jgi:hypothetical protein
LDGNGCGCTACGRGGGAARPRGWACGAARAVSVGGPLAFDSNTARQLLESCGVFARKHATMRPTSGTWSLHNRHTSGVQAICCSQVPRYSCDHAAVAAIESAQASAIRCIRIPDPFSFYLARVFQRPIRIKPAK